MNNLAAVPTSTGFVRGYTYALTEGSYGNRIFGTDESGTVGITVRKINTADSGVAGYSSTLHDGQAIFGSIQFSSGYWTLNGVTGGGPGAWETGLGFKIVGDISDSSFGLVDGNEDFITLEHIEMTQNSVTAEDKNIISVTYADNWTIRYCYIHDVGGDIFKLAYSYNNWLVEYTKFKTGYQSEAIHSDVFEAQGATSSNFIVRWNFFENVSGTYAFGTHDGNTINGYEVYGNIIWRRNSGFFFANAMISTLSAGGTITGFKFYNNTIVGNFDTGVGVSVPGGSISGEAKNNVWVEEVDDGYTFGYGSLTQTHNSHYNMVSVAGTGNENPIGAPFVNSAGGDFTPASALTAGTTLGAPYNIDMFGNAFDGDRGAIAYTGEGEGGGDLERKAQQFNSFRGSGFNVK
jgi:hypothetical protein